MKDSVIRKGTVLAMMAAVLISCKTQQTEQTTSLEGTWTIERAMGVSTAKGDDPAEITFENGGAVNGCSSVNNFFGNWEQKDGRLTLGKMGMTRKMGASMDVERAVVQGMNNAVDATVSSDKDATYIISAEGDTLLWLRRK